MKALGLYFAVFGALLGLTALTVWVAFQDFGAMSPYVGLLIAVLKGTLVVLYFMHLRHSKKLVWIFAGGAFLWLTLLVVGVLTELLSRGWIGSGRGG